MYTWIFVLLFYIKTAIKNIQDKTCIPKKLVSRGGPGRLDECIQET